VIKTSIIPERVQPRWEVRLPIYLTSLNKLMRMHWSRRAGVLKDEAMVILWFCDLAGVPRATGKRRVSQRITLVGRNKACDPDNMNKSMLDGLVKAGRLIDDSARWAELGSVSFYRGREIETHLLIEDIE
jgi:hypothetical protein